MKPLYLIEKNGTRRKICRECRKLHGAKECPAKSAERAEKDFWNQRNRELMAWVREFQYQRLADADIQAATAAANRAMAGERKRRSA